MGDQIFVDQLEKKYLVPVRAPGLKAAVSSLVDKKFEEIPAVRKIRFSVEEGETVALIGPNGAGKTTTLKMLSGLLYPSSGQARVLGCVPWDRSPQFLKSIAMVMGNKSQLMWDIPAMDTFKVLAEIFRVPPKEAAQTIEELGSLLALDELLDRPVRNLSLGERMKCELVAALLHCPKVLYLDEPTLGLDISIQRKLRAFIAEYNVRFGATILLTSHYMADVVELCERVILLHHGEIIYDGPLASLGEKLAPYKLIRMTLRYPLSNGLPGNVHVVSQEKNALVLRVLRRDTAAVTAKLLTSQQVEDLSVEEPPLEAVIDQIYQEGTV